MPVEHSIEFDIHKSLSKSLDLIWFGAASGYSERRVDVNSFNIDFGKPNETLEERILGFEAFMRMFSLLCILPKQAVLRIIFLRSFYSTIRSIHVNSQEISLP